MPMKCYNKPNRTKARTFSPCDAARIAREVVKDDPNSTPEKVLACIAKGLGFTHISLSRTGGRFDTQPAAIDISKSVGLIRSILKVVSGIAARLGLGSIKKWIVAILELLDKIEDALDVFQPDQEKVEDVLGDNYCKCKGDNNGN